MAAGHQESWLALQRQREERMRYEVLALLSDAVEGRLEEPFNVRPFAEHLGVWEAELFRAVEWLSRHGALRYCGAGPTVCLTAEGASVPQ